jgi:hypothetical protein
MNKMTKEQRQARLAELKELADAYTTGTSEETLNQTHPTLIGRFSFRNVCLILAQRPDALECAGFHDWLKVGRAVRKGSKGIAILVPITRKAEDPDKDPGVWFTWRYVFDISDTEAVEKEVAA